MVRPASASAPIATSACSCATDLSGAFRVGCSKAPAMYPLPLIVMAILEESSRKRCAGRESQTATSADKAKRAKLSARSKEQRGAEHARRGQPNGRARSTHAVYGLAQYWKYFLFYARVLHSIGRLFSTGHRRPSPSRGCGL